MDRCLYRSASASVSASSDVKTYVDFLPFDRISFTAAGRLFLTVANCVNCFHRRSLPLDEDIYIEALQRPPPPWLFANRPKRYADDAMRAWLHRRWGRGLEIKAASLQRCRQTSAFPSLSSQEQPQGRSSTVRPTKGSFLIEEPLQLSTYISIPFPPFLSLQNQIPASRSLTLRTRERFVRPSSRQTNLFFRHHRRWSRGALVFIDPRGTISGCSIDSASSLLTSNLPFCPAFLFSPPDNRASRRNANGSARTSPAWVLCHEKRSGTASLFTKNTASARA
jgi:hypothetical protein